MKSIVLTENQGIDQEVHYYLSSSVKIKNWKKKTTTTKNKQKHPPHPPKKQQQQQQQLNAH